MNILNKLKSAISVMLCVAILLSSISLNAASLASVRPSPAEHKATINQFISEIEDAQNAATAIAQSAVKSSASSNNQLQIDKISNDLRALNDKMEAYADIVQGLNEQDRQIRLTFNYLNLVRSSLVTLSALIRAGNDLERIQLLDEYFRTRLNASETLAILESLLEKYNTQSQ